MKNNNKELRAFRNFLASERARLLKDRGSYHHSVAAKPPQDNDLLKKSAQAAYRDFLTPFKPDAGQLDFTNRMLKIAKKMHVPNALVWVKVGPNLRLMQSQRKDVRTELGVESIQTFFSKEMQSIANANGSLYLDMNSNPDQATRCDLFFDSSHMAAYCFPEFTDYLFQSIPTSPDALQN